jgi:hypothetical protein
MSTAYRECPACGKRALSMATRCPQCGLEFPSRPLVRPGSGAGLRPARPGLVVLGLVVTAVVIVATLLQGHQGTTATAAGRTATRDTAAGTTVGSTSAAPPGGTPPVVRGVPRVVINWANVRQERLRSSAVVGRLEPGDSVMVDSLSRGWYRVLRDDRPVGYVHRTSVGTVLPTGSP